MGHFVSPSRWCPALKHELGVLCILHTHTPSPRFCTPFHTIFSKPSGLRWVVVSQQGSAELHFPILSSLYVSKFGVKRDIHITFGRWKESTSALILESREPDRQSCGRFQPVPIPPLNAWWPPHISADAEATAFLWTWKWTSPQASLMTHPTPRLWPCLAS